RRLERAVALLPGARLVVADAQRGASFAERLGNAVRDAAAIGFSEIVAVPCDVPALSAGELAAAFDALASGETPLGPSPDGGVYLIGMRAGEAHRLLDGVGWGTPRVL